MTTVYETNDYRLTVQTDTEPTNPREWDHVTHMVCAHDRYTLGDENARSFPLHRDWELYLKEVILDGVEEDDVVALPLYLYDHSGITMSTTPFSSRWDSGQVGWIYAHKDDLMDIPGVYEDNHFNEDKAYDILKEDVKEYDQYLTGSVYGYIAEKKDGCPCCKRVDYMEEDSLWGIFAESEDDAIKYIKESLGDTYGDIIAPENITSEG